MNPRNAIVAILAALSLSLALADDFKTIKGKEYKDTTVTRVEPDGIIVITFSGGIAKIPFNELSSKIKKKYGYNPQAAAAYSAEQSELQSALAQQRKADGLSAIAIEGAPVSSSQINLHWMDNANNEDGFELQRAHGGNGATPQCGTSVTLQSALPPNTIGFNDSGLRASHWYCYRVRAFIAEVTLVGRTQCWLGPDKKQSPACLCLPIAWQPHHKRESRHHAQLGCHRVNFNHLSLIAWR